MSLVNMILKWNTGAWVLKRLGVKIVMRTYGTFPENIIIEMAQMLLYTMSPERHGSSLYHPIGSFYLYSSIRCIAARK